MGLPGSGKTTLAGSIVGRLRAEGRTVTWLNADKIRKQYNDMDFSVAGRIRQSLRMAELAEIDTSDFVIADFIAPLPEMRENFNADCTIWMDTIRQGRYPDTNQLFVPPDDYDFRVTEQDAVRWSGLILEQSSTFSSAALLSSFV